MPPDWLPTSRYLPLGSAAKKLGCDPVVNGEFERVVSVPSDAIVLAAMLLDPSFATYKYLPEGSTRSERGAENDMPSGEPEIWVSAPSDPMVNSEIELSPKLAA